MKVFYKKCPSNIVSYSNYKTVNNESFINDLNEFLLFQKNYKYTSPKKHHVRANQAPFKNKNINKEIMKRNCLRNKFINTKSDIEKKAFNKQVISV